MGCWSPNQPDFGGRRPVSGVDCAPRTPRCFSASRSKATRQSSGIGARLRRIFKDRLLWCDASYQSGQQVCHRVKQQCAKVVAKLFPEVALGLHFVPSRLEQGTTQLLNLIYQESQHHQQGQHHRQVLLTVSVVMLQVISLVFQGVEGLILDLPAGSSPPHDVPDVLRNQEKVGDPTEMLNPSIGVDLPVFQHIDQFVGVGLVERHAIAEPKMMQNARRWILQGKDLHLAGLVEVLQVREQKGVVARLDANDVMRASLTQVAEVGGVGAEGVFDDDDRQVGMLLAKPFEPAAGGVPLAVVLGLTVLLDDRLGCQRDDFLEVGMYQGGPHQLMGIGDAAVAMVLLQAGGTMDFGGGKIGGAVQRQQVMAVQIDEAFQHLAPL